MKLITCLLLLFSFSVLASSITGDFIPPDKRQNGSTLPPDEIAGYNMFIDGVPDKLSPLPANATSFTTSPLTGGDYLIEIQTVDTYGQVSKTKYEVFATVPFADPNPPTGDGTYTIIP